MENEAGFSDPNLDKMVFPDSDVAIAYLKAMAGRIGFRLSLQDKSLLIACACIAGWETTVKTRSNQRRPDAHSMSH
jgi:hypothetical protein